MKCSGCGSSVPKGSEFCPKCGVKIPQEPSPKFARPPEQYTGPKKLYRSRKNRLVGGVCGGIGDHYNIDPTIVRLLWVIFILSGGAGLLAYLIAIVLIPESPLDPWVEQK